MHDRKLFRHSVIHLLPWGSRLTRSVLGVLPKNGFKGSGAFFRSLSGYKERKLSTKPFAGRTLRAHSGIV